MFSKYPELMNVEDVQKALGIGRSMAYRLINDGRIRHIRIGKVIKVPKRCLVEFVKDSCYNKPIATGNPSCHEERS